MLLAFMVAFFMGFGYLIGGINGVMIAFLIAIGVNLLSYWNSDEIVLRMYNAQEVERYAFPEYCRIVATLAKKAKLPQPRIYIINSPQPNAFATGRSPHHAAIAVTTGLLRRLSSEEIAGVISHELAHVQYYDTLTMMITATFAGAISMLGNFAFFEDYGHDSNGNSNLIGTIGTLIAIIIAPFAAMLVRMIISRTREYAADRRGAEICGNPLWLASALKKITQETQNIVNKEAENNPATTHIFIINPLSNQKLDDLFSTHPSTENRIAALYKMAQEMNIDIHRFEGGKVTGTIEQRPGWMKPIRKSHREGNLLQKRKNTNASRH